MLSFAGIIKSRAEPSRAEPSRAEPSRAEPSRAEPSRAEPSRAEPSRAEPSRAEPSRAEPSEPSRAEPSRAEPSRAEPSRAEPSRAEPSLRPTCPPEPSAARRARGRLLATLTVSRPAGGVPRPARPGGSRRGLDLSPAPGVAPGGVPTRLTAVPLHDAPRPCRRVRSPASPPSPPGRTPASRSARRTQLRSVSVEQPIFAATETMAARCDSCASWWSRTNRTARPRSSGGYLVEVFVCPDSQELRSPGNPGQFKQNRHADFWKPCA